MHFPRHHTLRLNLDSTLREYHSIEAPGNHHAISFDLPFHFRVLAEYDRLLRNNISLHVSVDTERSLQREGAFEQHSLINESCPLFTQTILRRAGPFPCHERILPKGSN